MEKRGGNEVKGKMSWSMKRVFKVRSFVGLILNIEQRLVHNCIMGATLQQSRIRFLFDIYFIRLYFSYLRCFHCHPYFPTIHRYLIMNLYHYSNHQQMYQQSSTTTMPPMLFLSNFKLDSTSQLPFLNGYFQIRDRDTSSIIVGFFNSSFCEKAQIYRNEQCKITKISVLINKQGFVLMGGSHVQQQNNTKIVYEGAYQGYVRHGFGVHFMQQYKKEIGIWKYGKREGVFVEELLEKDREEFIIIKYQDGMCIEETKITVKHGDELRSAKMKIIHKGDVIGSQELTAEQVGQWKRKVIEIKKSFEQYQSKQSHLSPLTPLNTYRSLSFSYKQVKAQSRLSVDICQAFLQYLSHSEQYQYKEKTAVLSIHTGCLFDLIREGQGKEQRAVAVENAKQRVRHLMLQYSGAFRLFRGYWKHIIIPLVLPKKYNHFTFVRVSLSFLTKRFNCVYYDSMYQIGKGQKTRSMYLKLIKDVLIYELLKDSTNVHAKQKILQMEMQVQKQFPRQANNDLKSCGYFMLQGVADLMKHGRIVFNSNELPIVKQNIRQTLKIICRE